MRIKTAITAAAAVAAGAVLTTAFAALAQSSSAAPSTSAGRPAPSQACVQAIANQMASRLAGFDAQNAKRKELMQAHQAAIAAAGNIADDTARQEAFQKANDDFRVAMKAEMMDAHKDDMQTGKDALKTACGDALPHGGMMGMGMMGRMGGRGGFDHHGRHHENDDDAANTQTNNQ